MKYCVYCGKELTGSQKKFCCDLHKTLWWYRIYEEEISKKGRRPNIPGAWDYIKNAALALSGGKCERCGKHTDSLEVHHIIPLYLDGDSTLDNLVVLCKCCHLEEHRKIRASVNLTKNHQQTIISFAGVTA